MRIFPLHPTRIFKIKNKKLISTLSCSTIATCS